MAHISRDVGYAIRRFVKQPTFTITAVLTLALAIGRASMPLCSGSFQASHC
jgi:hypothetical protein